MCKLKRDIVAQIIHELFKRPYEAAVLNWKKYQQEKKLDAVTHLKVFRVDLQNVDAHYRLWTSISSNLGLDEGGLGLLGLLPVLVGLHPQHLLLQDSKQQQKTI